MLRTEVVKLCQDNNFQTGFFEGTDNSTVVDAYELKVNLNVHSVLTTCTH
jgi:atypical dual specificity phosphatase